MKIYNTLTRQIEEIVPIATGNINMYSCGPTVYRFIHIGNLRTFTMADWLRRAFAYRGYQVLHVKNITDVGHMRQEMLDRGEDKLIAQARQEGKSSQQIAQFYTDAFHIDEAKLNILPAHFFPRATQHIQEMITIIQGLLAKGIAYEVNGFIYYDIRRFPDYGKLSGNQLQSMLVGLREGTDTARHNPEDFPLWKPAEPDREMAWDSPWGRGFPGWHIECSAMSIKYLGSQFDLHTGGVDNIFPHHEDEIAQSEGFTGHPFVNYWVHAQHLLADGQKMAKSAGNAYTCSDIESRGFDPLSLRYFYTTALYRSRLNFTFRALQAAQTSLERLRDLAYHFYLQAGPDTLLHDHASPSFPLPSHHNPWHDAFLTEVENDLNIPRAMSVVWSMLRSSELNASTKVRNLIDFDRILGFDLATYLQSDRPKQQSDPQLYLSAVPSAIADRVLQREKLRLHNHFDTADAIRQELNAAGYEVRDTPNGSIVVSRRPEDEFTVISDSTDAPDHTHSPDQYEFSINLLAHNNRDDLLRCIESVCRFAGGSQLELVIIDNGSTDDTLPYLQHLARSGNLQVEQGPPISLQILFADHNLGFAAARNATMRASRGHYLILLDTSIELTGNIWQPLAMTLADRNMGLIGPYGLVTTNLRDFSESSGPDVDAIEGYLMAFRRELLPEVGWIDEKFRFYRLADIYYSFFFKAAGYRLLATPLVTACITKHPHREWFSLSEDERAARSKKNYDIFRDRWHHGESLLVANYNPANLWRGHDHPYHLEGVRAHEPGARPAHGTMHTHMHHHWPDHSHSHPHSHRT